MSKLTWHFQYLSTAVDAIAAASGAQYIKVMDPPSNNAFPRKQVIGRTYLDDNASNALVAQGVEGAEQWFDRFLPVYNSRSYVTWWEGPNEPQNIYDPAFRAALVAFTLRLTELLHSIGKKCITLNLSVGAPDILDILDFRALAGKVDAIGLHEYSAPSMQSGEGWYCLRYRKYKAAWTAAGLWWPATFITETGIDGGVLSPPRARTGWKSYTDRAGYMAQLKWYDAELAKDPEVLAATIFTSGPNNDWRDFDFDADLSRDLAAHIASAPQPPPATLTLADRLTAAFGAQFTDLRARLPHGTPPYAERSLSAVNRVILHHTATAQSTTWETVARYHVNSLGWPGIAYHLGIHADGRVALLNNPETISYHAGPANGDSVALCVVGNYQTDTVNDMLWQRVLDVKSVLDAYMGRSVPMIGHRDAPGNATVCPGANLYARLTAPPPEVTMDPRAANCKAYHVNAAGQVDGIELVYVPVPSARYECISAQLIGEEAAQNNTVVTVEVFDKNGIKTAERSMMEWPYNEPPAAESPVGPGNPNNQFTIASVFSSKNIGPLGFFVADANKQPISDHIWGYGLPDARHISGYVAFKERGAVVPPTDPTYPTFAASVKGEAERHDILSINPAAALCKAGAAAGLWPTSNEYAWTYAGANYTGQRFRNPANDVVTAFYCVTGDWGNIKRLAW